MNKHIRKMEAARRLAYKIADIETARESERQEELRAEGKATRKSKNIGYGGHAHGSEEERTAMLADGCHPDSLDWDGADRGM